MKEARNAGLEQRAASKAFGLALGKIAREIAESPDLLWNRHGFRCFGADRLPAAE